MDKRILIVALTISLVNPAYAEISQEAAGKICEMYGSSGETTAVSGPILCEGFFWVCSYDYYGKKQSVFMAIDKFTGAVLSPTVSKTQVEGIGSAKYLYEYGGQYIANLPIMDSSFIIDLGGMNATFSNYGRIIDAVGEKGLIDAKVKNNLSKQIEELKKQSGSVSKKLAGVLNKSRDFVKTPTCGLDVEITDSLGESSEELGGYIESWGGFINEFNSKIAGITAPGLVISRLNPTEAQILSQRVQDSKSTLEEYASLRDDFISKAIGNIQTRMARKDTKDVLDDALVKVEKSKSTEAREKYNEAATAYNEGNYASARILTNEAISIALKSDNGDNGPIIIVEEAPDYTPYLVIVGVLLGLLFFVVLARGKRREEGGEEPLKKKGSWTWTKEKESSMEKSAKRKADIRID